MILKKCLSLINVSSNPRHLALSFCFGIYVAFSPFICLHTAMVLVIGWLCSLNIPMALLASCGINNPWTMIPIYSADYICGRFIVKSIMGVDFLFSNPAWMETIIRFLQEKITMPNLCLWSFLIGGNVLGLCCALCAYPFIYRFFLMRITKKQIAS